MSEPKPITPGICLISTKQYKKFVQPLLVQIDKYFLTGYHKKIFVFTDEWQPDLSSINHVIQILIPAYQFPYVSLYRYKFFTESSYQLQSCSHLFYLDVDMAIVGEVGEELLVDGIVAVRHPGFFTNDGWGDSSNPKESKSFLPIDQRIHYYCGGVQGGSSKWYLSAAKYMANGIAEDEKNLVKAEWHDETFWNHLIHTQGYPLTELSAEYCMPEQIHLQEKWGLSHLKTKIIALEKNHNEIRK